MVYLLMMQEFVGKPDAYRLRAIQDPQGESRGRGCRYRSPDKQSPRQQWRGFSIHEMRKFSHGTFAQLGEANQ